LYAVVTAAERDQLSLEAEVTATQIARRLEAWIDDRVAVSRHLARRQFSSVEDVAANYADVAARFVDLHSDFLALNYVDPEGVIRTVVPEAPNRRALGMNLHTHPSPGVPEALAAAHRADGPVSTPVVDLYQGGLGVTTYQALRDGTGRLMGFVNCVFRLETLVGGCLQEPELLEEFRFSLRDVRGRVAYRHDPAADAGDWPFEITLPVRVVDRPWTLRLAPTQAHVAQSRTWADETLGLVALALVLALTVALHQLLRRQQALAASRANYQLLVENQSDLVVKVDPQGRFLYVSPTYCDLFGVSEDELLGREFMPLVHEDDRAATAAAMESLFRPPHRAELEQRALTRHGWRWLHWTDAAVRDEQGEVTAIVASGRDITRQKELEDQLRQSQKMQAIGQLAGGIAHDFNNLLQAMLGHLEMLEDDTASLGPDVRDDLLAVRRSAMRAADLTRQLLAFSRQQARSLQALDLTVVVRDLEPLLRRLLGEGIALHLDMAAAVVPVHADRGQLEQVLMNLCVNARDAIGANGTIRIGVGRDVDPPCARLTVTDDGPGVPAGVRERIFEPFFTTKEVGQGTGLGLATVYGIVQQHDGEIAVDGDPGQGARFTITLPLTDRPLDTDAVDAPAPRHGGGETILLVEDEETLRTLASRLLERAGYRVRTAVDGVDAIVRYDADPVVDLVMLDLVMPRRGGRETARLLRERDATLPLLYVTGHEQRPPGADGDPDAEIPVLHKPYDAATLLERVRDVLDAARPTGAGDG
jgi:PAS domain S-box-containing protein